MSRLIHYAPTGDTDNAGGRYSRGRSSTGLGDDFGHHFLQLSNDTLDFRYDPSGSGAASSVTKRDTYRRFDFAIHRLPVVETGIWLNGSSAAPGSAALLLTVKPDGSVNFYNKGAAAFPGDLIGTVGSVLPLGAFHRVKIRCVFNSLTWAANDSFAEIYYLHGDSLLAFVSDGSVSHVVGTAVSNNGIATLTVGYRDVLGRLESNIAWMDVEFANLVIDDAAYPADDTRISAVQCAANGTFTAWTNNGIADWRARNTWPGTVAVAANPTTRINTVTAAQKQTYLMESFAAAGITGTILGARAHFWVNKTGSPVPSLIVIRNGVEVDTALWVPTDQAFLTYRLDTTGWALSDTIELGMISGTGTTGIGALVMSVEHDTPIPAVITGTSEADEINWTGNGTTQTVTLPFEPDAIFWWPRSAGSSGGWWFKRANTNQLVGRPGACDPNFIVRGTSLYLVSAEGQGANVNTTVYDALLISDPDMRMMCVGAYAEKNAAGRDAKPIAMLDTLGLPFEPLALLAYKEQANTNSFYRYRGPGYVGDSSNSIDTSGAAAADFIEELTATGFTAGLSMHSDAQQTTYVGFRRAKFLTTYLMDAVTYTGNGAGGTRVIPVDVSGATVSWAFVVPIASVQRAVMNSHQSGGKSIATGGGAYANSITALGADSITVGTALNTNAVVYSVLVFALGVDPGVITPCAGTGTVASGSNPSDGTSLATTTAPHAWIEVLVNGTTYRWAKVAINFGNPRSPRVLSFGSVVRALTDGRGSFESASATVKLSDHDLVLRGLHDTQALLNQPASIYVSDEATIRAAGTPWRVFRGVIRDFRPESDLTYTLVLEDPITLSFSAFGYDKLIPQKLIGSEISDATPTERVRDTPVQICYGNLSDEDASEPIGTVFAPYTSSVSVATDPELDNCPQFLVSRGAIADVQSVFIGDPSSADPLNPDVPLLRAKVPAAEFGVRVMCPFKPGWFEPDDFSDRSGWRYTFVYLRDDHPGTELAVTGRIPMLVNVCGRETTGDATGSAIGSLPRQFLHCLNNEVLQVAPDEWLAQYQFDGFALLNTASFEACKTVSEGRISGGYLGAFVLGHSFRQVSLRDLIEQFCRSGDMDIGVNRHGQIIATMLDRTSTASGASLFTDMVDIIAGSLTINPKTDEIENQIRYVYKRNYAPALQQLNPDVDTRLPREPFDGTWLSGLLTIEDATSIADIGETRASALLELEMVRDENTAVDVAEQRLALRAPANGRAVATFTVPIGRGIGVELGDIVKVTHFQGIGSTGWAARRLQVRRHEVNLDAMTVTITGRDVHDLLA